MVMCLRCVRMVSGLTKQCGWMLQPLVSRFFVVLADLLAQYIYSQGYIFRRAKHWKPR